MQRSGTVALVSLGFAFLFCASVARAEEKNWTHLRIATEGAIPPWNYTKPDGTIDGYEIDLIKYLCTRMKVECSMVVEPFSNMIPALNAGEFDVIMSGMSVTTKRQETIAFSDIYSQAGETFATLATSPLADMPLKGHVLSIGTDQTDLQNTIKELTPLLKGKILGVQAASTDANFAQTYLKDIVQIREYQEPEQHDLDLVSGRIDLVLASAPLLTLDAAKENHKNMVIVGPRFTGGLFGKGSGAGFRKEDTKLKDMFNEAIEAAKKDGTMKTLSQKWFGFDVTPPE